MDLQFEKYIYEEILKIASSEHMKHEFGTILFHENKYELLVHKTYDDLMENMAVLSYRKVQFSLDFSLDGDKHFYIYSGLNIFTNGILKKNQAICYKINYDRNTLPNGQKIDWAKLKEEKDEILNLFKKKVS